MGESTGGLQASSLLSSLLRFGVTTKVELSVLAAHRTTLHPRRREVPRTPRSLCSHAPTPTTGHWRGLLADALARSVIPYILQGDSNWAAMVPFAMCSWDNRGGGLGVHVVA